MTVKTLESVEFIEACRNRQWNTCGPQVVPQSETILARSSEAEKGHRRLESRALIEEKLRRSTRFGVFIHRFIHSWNFLSIFEHELRQRSVWIAPN